MPTTPSTTHEDLSAALRSLGSLVAARPSRKTLDEHSKLLRDRRATLQSSLDQKRKSLDELQISVSGDETELAAIDRELAGVDFAVSERLCTDRPLAPLRRGTQVINGTASGEKATVATNAAPTITASLSSKEDPTGVKTAIIEAMERMGPLAPRDAAKAVNSIGGMRRQKPMTCQKTMARMLTAGRLVRVERSDGETVYGLSPNQKAARAELGDRMKK